VYGSELYQMQNMAVVAVNVHFAQSQIVYRPLCIRS